MHRHVIKNSLVALVLTLFCLSSNSQSAESFNGQWAGYIIVKDQPVFVIFFTFKSYEQKTIAASYSIYPYGGDTSSLIEKKQLVFDYDKQKNMAYINSDWPTPDGSRCTGYLTIDIDKKDASKVNASFKLNKSCMDARITLNKAEYIVSDSIFQAHLLKVSQVKNEKVTEPSTFKIDPKDVTHSEDKDFKWYDWAKAPKNIISATHFIHINNFRTVQKDKILFNEIQEYIADKGTTLRVAAIDLDNDGVYGVAIEVAGSNYCGTMGCTYEFYDNGGLKSINSMNDHGPSPDKNRVKASTGDYYSLKSNNITVDQAEIARLFTYEKPTTVKKGVPVLPTNILGGSTPDELGKLLLKALQTNNKKLWESCMHPTYNSDVNPDHRQWQTDQFDMIKSYLLEKGLKDWKKVSFRRVTTDPCQQCAPPGEKFLAQLYLEFWYDGKEYLGGLNFAPVITYKGKYFVGTCSSNDFEPFLAK